MSASTELARNRNGKKMQQIQETEINKSVSSNLRTYADNVALPSFAGCWCWALAMQHLIDISFMPGPQQQACRWDREMDGRTNKQTEGWTAYCYIDPAVHTKQAVIKILN